MGVFNRSEFNGCAMRHAAAKIPENPRHPGLDWLPGNKFRKTIAGLGVLAAAATFFTARISINFANENKDTATIGQTGDSQPPAVSYSNQPGNKQIVDRASRVDICSIWQEQGQIGRDRVCPNPDIQINPGVQPMGGSDHDTQFYVNINNFDQSTAA